MQRERAFPDADAGSGAVSGEEPETWLRRENARLREQLVARERELLQERTRQLEVQAAHEEAGHLVERLESRLAERERENRVCRARYSLVEQQASRLLKLYVAAQRLHEAPDRQRVLVAIQEIVTHIIGSEEMAIFRLDLASNRLMLMAAQGIGPERFCSMRMGEGIIGEVAHSGKMYLAPTPVRAGAPSPEAVSACVPLCLGSRVHGVLAIFGMLPQKRGFDEVDTELLLLLEVQAATALVRAELFGHTPSPTMMPLTGTTSLFGR